MLNPDACYSTPPHPLSKKAHYDTFVGLLTHPVKSSTGDPPIRFLEKLNVILL